VLRVMLRVVWRLVVLVRVVHFRKVRRMHGLKKKKKKNEGHQRFGDEATREEVDEQEEL